MGTNKSATLELNQGFRTTTMVMRGKIKPQRSLLITRASVTEGGTGADAAATSITVEPVTAAIDKGNWLRFEDSNELAYLAEVTQDAAVGDTSLNVSPLVQAIPAGAIAKFPPEVLARTDAPINRSVNVSDTQNFNTGGTAIRTTTTSDYTVDMPGERIVKDAGYLTAFYAADEKAPVWVCIVFEPPAGDAASGIGPETFIGKAFVTDYGSSAPSDGFRNSDLSFTISGKPDEVLFAAAT